jgi:flagellar motor component MotA
MLLLSRDSVSPQCVSRPFVFLFTQSLTAIRLTRALANAVAFATMSHVFGERTDPVAWLLQPPPVIITIEEGGQIRAAVVRFSSEDGQQHPGKMQTIFQSSLCGSEAEALVLLYERSRTAVTGGKRSLEERGLWQRL